MQQEIQFQRKLINAGAEYVIGNVSVRLRPGMSPGQHLAYVISSKGKPNWFADSYEQAVELANERNG